MDKVSIVLGPFFLIAALLPVLRQEKLLTPDIELAGLVLASGVLSLLAQAPAFPWPGQLKLENPLRTRLHAVAVGVAVAGLLVSGIGALTWLGAAMLLSESAMGDGRSVGNIAVLGGVAVAVVAGVGVVTLAKRRPFGPASSNAPAEPATVRGTRLLVPLLSIGLGASWFILGELGTNQMFRIWSPALASIGILALAVGGFDKIGVVLGPAYLLVGAVSWRQHAFGNAAVPIIIAGIGVLLLLAQSPAVPEPGQTRMRRRPLKRAGMGIAIGGLALMGLGFLARLANAMMMEGGSELVALLGISAIAGGIVVAIVGGILAVVQLPAADEGTRLPLARWAVWNIISMATPVVGFLCGFAVAAANANRLRGSTIALGLGVWLAFGVFGLVAAAIAFARGERWWGLTLAAFLLNLAVAIGLATATW